MKFRFCGDQDCPDWLLAEMSTLSRLTSIKTKLVAIQVIQTLLKESDESELDLDKVKSLSSDAKLSTGDVLAGTAALAFIFKSSAKFGVPTSIMETELQQLGLPKEHSVAIGRVYSDNFDNLVEILKRKVLVLTKNVEIVSSNVENIEMKSKDDGQSSTVQIVKLKIKYWSSASNSYKTDDLSLSPIQLKLLIGDLEKANSLMSELS